MDRRREKIIFDNRSSKPLYEAYDMAFDFYFNHWDEACRLQVMIWGDFNFVMKTNRHSITIQIYDKDCDHSIGQQKKL